MVNTGELIGGVIFFKCTINMDGASGNMYKQ